MTILRETLKKPTFAKKSPSSMLVLRFNNRWRWCSGHFNFRQRTLELDCRGVFQPAFFFIILVLKINFTFRLVKNKILLSLHRVIRVVSRELCRRYIVK